jgi:hypothetical protein
MSRWTMILLTLIFCAALPAKAQKPTSQRTVSLHLQQVPLRQALQLLFENGGVSFAIDPDVRDTLITLNVKEVPFNEALRTLVRLGSSSGQAVTYEVVGGAYHVQVGKPEPAEAPAAGDVWEKIQIQFLRAEELLAQLEPGARPAGVRSLTLLPADNSLLARGDADAIADLKNIIRFTDEPTKTLALSVGVRGPGPNGRPVELESQAHTIRDHNVTINDQIRVGTQIGRLSVRLKPLLQGDGGILLDSDWDVSVPLAGGAQGPVQFVKRLTTTTRVPPGQSAPVVVGQVDLSGWGGKGVLRLWVRANVLPDRPPAALSRAAK